jgi:biotin carboxyl carrier protein
VAAVISRPVRVSVPDELDTEGRVVSHGDGELQLSGSGRGVLRPAGQRRPVTRVSISRATPPSVPGDSRGHHRVEVVIDGWRFELEVEDAARAGLRERASRERGRGGHGGPTELRAIIPGRVVSVAVAPGDSVEMGDDLLVIEAMKMQNELRAPRTGVVERVAVGAGQTVELGDLLVVVR